MQAKLLLVTFYFNDGLRAVSVRKPSARMSKFRMVVFLKNKSQQNFGFPHVPPYWMDVVVFVVVFAAVLHWVSRRSCCQCPSVDVIYWRKLGSCCCFLLLLLLHRDYRDVVVWGHVFASVCVSLDLLAKPFWCIFYEIFVLVSRQIIVRYVQQLCHYVITFCNATHHSTILPARCPPELVDLRNNTTWF